MSHTERMGSYIGGSGSPDWSDVKLKYEDVVVQIMDKKVVVTVGDKAPVVIQRP